MVIPCILCVLLNKTRAELTLESRSNVPSRKTWGPPRSKRKAAGHACVNYGGERNSTERKEPKNNSKYYRPAIDHVAWIQEVLRLNTEVLLGLRRKTVSYKPAGEGRDRASNTHYFRKRTAVLRAAPSSKRKGENRDLEIGRNERALRFASPGLRFQDRTQERTKRKPLMMTSV